jgi:DNA-binding CsgD family transcriptional regulator/predicted adenine nucleotide alpha hydrolase (AANH) superfamily ATPase
MKEQQLHKLFFQMIQNQDFELQVSDYQTIEKEIDFLKQLDKMQSGAIRVYDCYALKYLYLSDSYFKLFEHEANASLNEALYTQRESIHPEDITIISATSIEFVNHLFSQDKEKRKSFKVAAEYRAKTAKGKYVRVITQDTVFRQTNNGSIWLLLNTIDLAPEQDLESAAKISFYNLDTGEPLVTSKEVKKRLFSDIFSKRELEVLVHLSEGSSSKAIADKLFISVNTVNNHRRNIISKLNISNTSEAITLASNMGLI